MGLLASNAYIQNISILANLYVNYAPHKKYTTLILKIVNNALHNTLFSMERNVTHVLISNFGINQQRVASLVLLVQPILMKKIDVNAKYKHPI
jgi:hypothetical protein